MDPVLKGEFAGLVKRAYLQLRFSPAEGGRLSTGGTHPAFFRLIALQGPDGTFLADAQERIRRGGHEFGLDRMVARNAEVQGLQTTLWGEHELAIASNLDTVEALHDLEEATGGALSFYRLTSTDALLARLFVWSLLTEFARGTPASEIVPRIRKQRGDRLVAGLVQMAPASAASHK